MSSQQLAQIGWSRLLEFHPSRIFPAGKRPRVRIRVLAHHQKQPECLLPRLADAAGVEHSGQDTFYNLIATFARQRSSRHSLSLRRMSHRGVLLTLPAAVDVPHIAEKRRGKV